MVARRRLEDLTIKEIAAIAQKATRLAAEKAAKRRADVGDREQKGSGCPTAVENFPHGHCDPRGDGIEDE